MLQQPSKDPGICPRFDLVNRFKLSPTHHTEHDIRRFINGPKKIPRVIERTKKTAGRTRHILSWGDNPNKTTYINFADLKLTTLHRPIQLAGRNFSFFASHSLCIDLHSFTCYQILQITAKSSLLSGNRNTLRSSPRLR